MTSLRDDPGTYGIVDGDLYRLNHDMGMTMRLVGPGDHSIVLFRSGTTLGRKLVAWLETTVGCLDADAIRGSVSTVRSEALD